MKPGDLVRYDPEKIPAEGIARARAELGVVVKTSVHRLGELRGGSPQAGLPMALVKWNHLPTPMRHRQDLLEVLSEAR
jgi:hypothetical protein